MASLAPSSPACPFHEGGDMRKSTAAAARAGVTRPERVIDSFDGARAVLRDEEARQAGFKADLIDRFGRAAEVPILFQSGEAHRRQRAATARFFAPKTVATRYRELIERTARAQVARLEAKGEADLDALSLEMAVAVAAEIVGLTESELPAMSRRLDAFFSTAFQTRTDRVSSFLSFILGQWRMIRFYRKDVKPAMAARRLEPREDVVSHLIAQGYSKRAILTECFTYGAAGMVTTREFITMAGWHLLEDEALRTRFLDADEGGRMRVLEEILRLEPVVGQLYRKLGPETVALDIRGANQDAAAMGACPHLMDPDRARAPKTHGAGLAFGDGPHRCPGADVALNEAAIFLDMLLRVPGLRLVKAPKVGWNPLITGYELRGCRIAVR